jgi:GNAT superfamily N-acetyltransferase
VSTRGTPDPVPTSSEGAVISGALTSLQESELQKRRPNKHMHIIDLKFEPQHIDLLAKWQHEEWRYLNPNGTVEKRAEKMLHYLGAESIPSAYVAKINQELTGSASIVKFDMDTHRELSPWLASVFVSPDHRNKGVGTALVRHVMDQAKLNSIKTLYLFTPDKEKFYRKLGLAVLCKEEYRGYPVTIMSVNLHG